MKKPPNVYIQINCKGIHSGLVVMTLTWNVIEQGSIRPWSIKLLTHCDIGDQRKLCARSVIKTWGHTFSWGGGGG